LTWQAFCGTEGASATYSAEAWEHFARDCVADLRAAAARYPGDPAITGLVRRLLSGSKTFAAWWDEHQVRVRRGGHKRLAHPAVGELELDYDVLIVPDHDQRVVIYSAPPGSAVGEALRLLAVLSTQDMRSSAGSPAQR
jgi:hypothetical protein